MDEQELLAIEQWAQAAKDHGGCGMTCSGVDDLLAVVAEVRRLQAELAGYVKGYDPKELRPAVGVPVVACGDDWWDVMVFDGDVFTSQMPFRKSWCRADQVTRWYPMVGGGR